MLNAFEYVFYRLYKFVLNTPNRDIAPWVTNFLLSLLMGLNILTIYSFLNKMGIIHSFLTKQKQGGALMLLVFAGNYYIFVFKGKYKYIIMEYSNEGQKDRKIHGLFVAGYIIISIILLFASVIIKINPITKF